MKRKLVLLDGNNCKCCCYCHPFKRSPRISTVKVKSISPTPMTCHSCFSVLMLNFCFYCNHCIFECSALLLLSLFRVRRLRSITLRIAVLKVTEGSCFHETKYTSINDIFPSLCDLVNSRRLRVYKTSTQFTGPIFVQVVKRSHISRRGNMSIRRYFETSQWHLVHFIYPASI